MPTASADFERSAAVFVGRVVKQEYSREWPATCVPDRDFASTMVRDPDVPSFGFQSTLSVTFEVERAWKGTPGDTTSILTGQDDGICGFHFVPGETYLVYAQAYGAGDIMFTHSCSRSHEAWAGDPDPAALDAVTPVRGRTWGALKLHYR